jgi:translation initiation factor 3 subunit C
LNHTEIEYIQRIQDENALLFLADRVSEFFALFNQAGYLARVGIIKLTYLYYKNDTIYSRIRERLAAKGKVPQNPSNDLTGIYLCEDSANVIAGLVKQIQAEGNPRMKVRSVLYQIYHLALHNKFDQARDLLMKTHMSQLITTQPVEL